jgi:sugar lactone lactonase YvrE
MRRFEYQLSILVVLFVEETLMKRYRNIYKRIQIIQILVFLIVFVAVQAATIVQASNDSSKAPVPKLLILDDCDKDDDLGTPPYGDAVFLLDSNGELKQLLDHLQVFDFMGRCRNISVSEDGRFFIVCHNGAITMYETATGRELWPLQGRFWSAALANGLIYALDPENVYAINNTGTIVKHGRFGGLDIAIDTNNNCIWIVGLNIRKLSLDFQLNVQIPLTLSEPDNGAFSVDVCPDGSVWVAERNVNSDISSKSRLLKISQQGEVVKKIDIHFLPNGVRVNKSDGSIWVTGMTSHKDYLDGEEWPKTIEELRKLEKITIQTFTQKYNADGQILFEIDKGGNSLDIDPSDGSVWIACQESILRYSSKGEKLAEYTGFSEGKKWLAVISNTAGDN